jgi:hypothetical protein
MKTDMPARVAGTQKVLSKYRGKPFEWGKNDCVRMARTQLVAMGHKPPKLPRYNSEKTAIRRLKEAGFDSVEDMLGSMLVEIEPARRLAGDLATVKGEGKISAIVVCAGGKWLGWPADEPAFSVVNLTPDRVYRV